MSSAHIPLGPTAAETAPRLLGAVLRRGPVAVRITEVEAYEGQDDPASHAWRGPSRRNAVMFGPAGHLYTYQMHGHVCCNVVSSPAGVANAVLIRAGRVIDGIEVARERRGPSVRDAWLARGPGCLTRALGITMADGDTDLFDPRSAVRLEPGDPVGPDPIRLRSGPRVGVSRAAEEPLRFWLADEPSVSAYKRVGRKPPTR
ncbi:DNA-3-methyladenine glycosylase [Propionibacteriaceae bacterium ES.041]|uniref:DNA-3-methyladenine glycosylase n=1 Tax=Enemella evansiae TaxID=2016499 RepID=UPI000B976071|nr:DNA-3-methyladenine glycosylase [Enemella evansiae]OYO00996.1 3-methyladenine DNA glycosylase [Enemella evansiae]PFG68257.1 DNA-3-methyladenine glycosylase [Propionibacteriaceae bacterium ES.041]